jgi:hypothetical protein
MQHMRPDVSWLATSCVSLTNPDGVTYDWQTLMTQIGDATMADVNADPSRFGFQFGQGAAPSERGPLSRIVLGA